MGIKVKSTNKVQIVEMTGDITIGREQVARLVDLRGNRLDDVGETLRALLQEGHKHILLNLQHVRFIDSGGLGELIACKKRALEKGGDIKLLNPTKRVYDLFEMLQLTEVFKIFQDETQALNSFGGES